MAVIGTFGSFTAARLGIYASQASLNVTGNNIANINTTGYTRQRADLVSLHSAGSARYASDYNLDIGYGVLVDQVSQLRDPYLDILYRDEQANVGFYEATVKGLQQISQVLDEVGKGTGKFGVLHGQFEDFLAQLQGYNNRVNDEDYDTTVRGSAESIVNIFNTYAKKLATVKENMTNDLKNDITQVNTILTEIRDLNAQIRNANIFGHNALELKDQRNVLIDKLSSYMEIEVQYSYEPIDEFSQVEKLSITLANSGNPPKYLVNGIYGTQIDMPEEIPSRNPYYNPELPTSNRYISRNSDFDAVPPKILYTNIEREAMRDNDNNIITNDGAGETLLKAMGYAGIPETNKYDINATDQDGNRTSGQYLDANGDPTDVMEDAALIDNAQKGSDANRLWMRLQPLVDERGRYIKDEYGRDIDEIVELGDNDLYGSLQAKRELITEEGEFASKEDLAFDPNANVKRGITYFQRSLDALARKFAESFNNANTVNGEQVFLGYETETGRDGIKRYKMNADCDLITGGGDAADVVQKIMQELNISEADAKDYLVRKDGLDELSAGLRQELLNVQMKHLEEAGHGTAVMGGGVLFSVSGDSDDVKDAEGKGITAANISIAKSWSTGGTRLLPTKNYDPTENTTADDNIYHMIGMMYEEMNYKPEDIADIVGPTASDGTTYFSGSFQQRLSEMNNTLATKQQTATTNYTAFEISALSWDNQRQSVSGVDLNEEATSMMMFQKSYAAACQLLTTLDSMLDKLINGTI